MRRSGWLLVFLFILLAIGGTIGIIVYNGTKQRMTATSQVSFDTCDADVLVQGKVQNAKDLTGENDVNSFNYPVPDGAKYDESTKFNSPSKYLGYSVIDEQNPEELSTWNIGDLSFIKIDNLSETIIISLKITNYSDFPVKCSIIFSKSTTQLDLSNITRFSNKTEAILAKSGEENDNAEFVVRYSVKNMSSPVSMADLRMNLDIEKAQTEPELPYKIADWQFELAEGNTSYIVTKYIGTDTEIVVPDKYNNLDVKQIGIFQTDEINANSMVFSKNTQLNTITSITIPSSIRFIGSNAFAFCNISQITLPTTLSKIGKYAFRGCLNLLSISIPVSVTQIEPAAFFECSKLESIQVDDENLVYSDKNANIIYEKTSDAILQACKTSTIPSTTVILRELSFAKLSNWTSITLPNTVVTVEKSAFSDCDNLETLNLGIAIKNIDDKAFFNCTKLKNITISNVLESIGENAFENCTKITTLTLPASVNSISDYAFKGCTDLQDITVFATVPPIISEESMIFNLCLSLTKICVLPSYVTTYKTANGWSKYASLIVSTEAELEAKWEFELNADESGYIINKYKGNETEIFVPSTYNSLPVVQIGRDYEMGESTNYYVFSDGIADSEITSISIPNSIKKISTMSFAFCNNLSSLNIPEGVETISDCSFAYCQELINLNIPASVTLIGEGIASNCISLANIVVADTNQNYSDMDSNIIYEKSTDTLLQGCNNSVIPNTTKIIGVAAFLFNNVIRNISIPDSVITIDTMAFGNCSELETVAFGSGLKNIKNNAFYNCDKLNNFELPSGLLSLGNWAFADCGNLTTIVVPETVTSISDECFSSCENLENLLIMAINPPSLSNQSKFIEFCLLLEHIYVPYISVETYKSAPGWSEYASMITSVDEYLNRDWTLVLNDEEDGYIITKYTGDMTVNSLTLPQSNNGIPVVQVGPTIYSENIFNYTNSIKSLIVPEGIKVLSVCSLSALALTSLSLPQSLTSIYQQALSNVMLQELFIPKNVTLIEPFILIIGNINSITIDDENTKYSDKDCNVIYDITTDTVVQGCINSTIPQETKIIGNNAFEGIDIETITIPDSVISLQNEAFMACSYLTTVSLGRNIEEIDCFQSCSKLDNVVLNENLKKIGNRAFAGCIKLKNITFNSKLEEIGWQAFIHDSALENILLPSSIIRISSEAFENCPNIVTFTILAQVPPTVTESVNSENRIIFGDNGNTEKIFVPFGTLNDYKTATGWSIYSEKIFEIELEQTLEGWTKVLNLTETGYILTGYSGSETEIIVPLKLDDLPVIELKASLFEGNTSITSVSFLQNLKVIGNYAFRNCTNLAEIKNYTTFESFGRDVFKNTAWYNEQNDGLVYYKNILLGYKNTAPIGDIELDNETYLIADYALYGCANISSVNLKTNLKYIGNQSFSGCSLLSGLSLPNGLLKIGVSAFASCAKLQTIALPDTLTLLDKYAFYSCSDLTSVSSGTASLKINGYAFSECEKLTTVNFGSGLNSFQTNVFYKSPMLNSITISESNTKYSDKDSNVIYELSSNKLICGCRSSVIPDTTTTINSSAFSGCTNLVSLIVPDSVVTIGQMAFSECSAMTSISFGKNVANFGDYVLNACTELVSIIIDEQNTKYSDKDCNVVYDLLNNEVLIGCKNSTIPTDALLIGNYAFNSCYTLQNIVIPDSVTTIGHHAFEECKGLRSVTIGTGVTHIFDNAFKNCILLESVTINTLIPPTMGLNVFEACNELTSIKVNASVLNDYRTANGWSDYVDLIISI